MHEYDTVLKELLRDSRNSVLELISGTRVERWLRTELPKVEQPRVDLLGESASGDLIHIELQSTNEGDMAVRMGEYMFHVLRTYGRIPMRYVLYVGEAPLRMAGELTGWKLVFGYDVIDMRDFDSEKLLESPWMSDNVIAILARMRDRRETVRRVLARIAQLKGGARVRAFQQLSILAGLRHLGNEIQEEVKQVPILDDIMDHDLLGPAIRKGIQEGIQRGLQQGLQQGLEEGRLEGTRETTRHLIEKRFGTLPPVLLERFVKLTRAELDAVASRLLDAKSAEELF